MNQNNINNNSRNVEIEELKQPNIINDNDDNDEIKTNTIDKSKEDNKEEKIDLIE